MAKRKKQRNIILFFVLSLLIASLLAHAKMIEYALPVITSDLKEAADLGYNVMNRGGNAVDAAIVAALTVGSINAFASGLGGGGFLLLMKDRKCFEYNFREKAPGSAHSKNYKIKNDSLRGLKSVAIPNEILGLFSVHLEYGKLPWSELFTELIALLKTGFAVPPVLSQKLNEYKHIILSDEGLRNTYCKKTKDGINLELVQENDFIKRENLARTLEILAKNPFSFYSGEIADSLLRFINKDQIYITPEELKIAQVVKKAVKSERLDDNIEIYTTSLPTTGYMLRIALAIIKKIKEHGLHLNETALQRHLVIIFNELFKIRAQLDDLQDEEKNLKTLLMCTEQKKIVSSIFEKINRNKIFVPYLNKFLKDHGTTHINVIDKDEMMVSLTSTINQYWGSGLMDPITGIILNNQIDDFTFKKYPNGSDIQALYGKDLEKNEIKPYKQPLSSAMPAFIKIDKDFFVLGSSGGIRIPSAVISTLARIILQNSSIEDAINHPRLHYQGGDIIKIENNYTNALPNMGVLWKVHRDSVYTISSCVHIIKYMTDKKIVYSVADKRKHAVTVGSVQKRNKKHSELWLFDK